MRVRVFCTGLLGLVSITVASLGDGSTHDCATGRNRSSSDVATSEAFCRDLRQVVSDVDVPLGLRLREANLYVCNSTKEFYDVAFRVSKADGLDADGLLQFPNDLQAAVLVPATQRHGCEEAWYLRRKAPEPVGPAMASAMKYPQVSVSAVLTCDCEIQTLRRRLSGADDLIAIVVAQPLCSVYEVDTPVVRKFVCEFARIVDLRNGLAAWEVRVVAELTNSASTLGHSLLFRASSNLDQPEYARRYPEARSELVAVSSPTATMQLIRTWRRE